MKATQIRSGRTVAGYAGTASLLAAALMCTQGTLAAEPGWYMGANIGESRARIDRDDIIARLLEDGYTSVIVDEDESDTAFKIFAGYQFNRVFALEGGYFNLGSFNYRANLLPVATMNADVKFQGLNIDLVASLPLSENLSAFGRIGVNYAETKGRFSATGAATPTRSTSDEKETNEKFGLGLQYDFSETLSMRLEAERYRLNDSVGSRADVDMYSLGLLYRFGARPAPAAVAAPPPAPAPTPPPRQVAPAPAPEPAPAPAPLMRVNLSADSLYSFDDASVRPAGQRELDTLIRDLQDLDFGSITVTGHTDRIGSSDYNQALSLRRAEAVKTYLLESSNIPANKIVTRGAGSSQPLTSAAQCPASLSRAELMTCLQADRRVEVEVTGTEQR